MPPDLFFDAIGPSKARWVILGLIFAVFDYVFNLIMNFIIGGYQADLLTDTFRRMSIQNFNQWNRFGRVIIRKFIRGGNNRVKEFQSDNQSWIWPLTILAIPIITYGVTRASFIGLFSYLESIGIEVEKYTIQIPNQSTRLFQLTIFLLAQAWAFTTFYRYRHRSEKLWFTKSIGYHLSRTVIFDFSVTFSLLNITVLWIFFMLSVFRILSDSSLNYPMLHSDSMYGLRPVYDAILVLNTFLLVLSFFPLIMLIRESKQIYSRMYFFLTYLLLFGVIAVSAVLIIQFDNRLESIHQSALNSIIPNHTPLLDYATLDSRAFQVYSVILQLPAGFEIPTWLESLFGFRFFLLLFELTRLISPGLLPGSFDNILSFINKRIG